MAKNGFSDPKVASKAGKKSKRGKDKLTCEIKDGIAKVISGQVKNLERDLKAMSEKERWAVIIGLSEFAIPKLARTEVKAEHSVFIDGIEYLKPDEDKAGTNDKTR